MQNRFTKIESVLVADCGSNITRVALVEVVDQAYRFVARGEPPSTLEEPFPDVTIGVINAISAIEDTTGKRLLARGKLITPQQEDGSGVDAFVASSSAAEPLRVVAAGLVKELSGASAARASHGTYTNVLGTISLDDYGDDSPLSGLESTSQTPADYALEPPDADLSPFANRKDRPAIFPSDSPIPANPDLKKTKKRGSTFFKEPARRAWKERQVAKLRRLAPNVVVISGGSQGAKAESYRKLVEVVLEANRQERILAIATGETRRVSSLVFAGPREAQAKVIEQVAGQCEVFPVDTIRPSPERENLAPMQAQLATIYQERLLPTLPGYRRLSEMSNTLITTTSDAVSLITRFLAKDVEANRVLTADLGGSNAALFYADAQDFASMVRGGFGLSFGLSNVLAETTPDLLRRWLPFEINDDELIHYALNKTLRPQILPATERELFIEGAFGREALRVLMEELGREAPNGFDYNRLIGAGGPLVNAPLWQTALLLLDGLQPAGASESGLVELDLDSTMLMAAAGTLAALNPNAAAYLFRYDCLHRLGAVVVVQGKGTPGAPAARVRLRKGDDHLKEIVVPYGSIALLHLRADERATLEIQLESSFRIGSSRAGALVSTAEGTFISGGALGLIIDARGRPINFAADPAARMAQVADWYNVYREALKQAEQEGSDDFAPTSDPSEPSQPTSGLLPNAATNEPASLHETKKRGFSLGRRR
jgi:hypothetical protein